MARDEADQLIGQMLIYDPKASPSFCQDMDGEPGVLAVKAGHLDARMDAVLDTRDLLLKAQEVVAARPGERIFFLYLKLEDPAGRRIVVELIRKRCISRRT